MGKAGKIIKTAATAFVFVVIAMFVIRCCMAADKSKFSVLTPTDALRAAWSDGESDILTCKVEAELSADGYFAAYGFYYNPESGEVQFAVRWNRSVYRYTDMPEGHEFAFRLRNEATGEEWPARAIDADAMSVYSYRKMLAEGVRLDDASQLSVVMELRDGFESVQVLKHAEQPLVEYKPKKDFLSEVQK